MPRFLRRAMIATIWASVLVPAHAFAHGELSSSNPAAGEELTSAPRELRLTFTGAVELPFARVTLTGPNGQVALTQLALSPDSASVVVAGIEGRLESGEYTVHWQVAGPDGHPVRGEYGFTILEDAEGLTDAASATAAIAAAAGEGEAADPVQAPVISRFDAESPLYVFVRWVTFLGLLGVIGVVAFRGVVLGLMARNTGQASRTTIRFAATRATGFGLGAVALLGAALFMRLYAQSFALFGGEGALDPSNLGTLLASTTWGAGWLLQGAGLLAALGGLLLARRERIAGWAIAGAGAVALAFTPALSGHAAAEQEMTGLVIAADALHVLGAGGWLGSLLLVLVVGMPAALRQPEEHRGREVAALINAFSPTALLFAGLVVATGVFASWVQLENFSSLWQSTYGRILLVKLAFLTVVFGTGAYNWLKVKPALGETVAADRLRRSATLELGVGVAVVAVTAVLVATATPSVDGAHSVEPAPTAALSR